MGYKPLDFNQRGRDILNHNFGHASCPWCGFNIMEADDLVDAGERETDHTCLLQVIEDIDERGHSWLSMQWECLKCHKSGTFNHKGPRTDADMVRKQRDAMLAQYRSEGGES